MSRFLRCLEEAFLCEGACQIGCCCLTDTELGRETRFLLKLGRPALVVTADPAAAFRKCSSARLFRVEDFVGFVCLGHNLYHQFPVAEQRHKGLELLRADMIAPHGRWPRSTCDDLKNRGRSTVLDSVILRDTPPFFTERESHIKVHK